MESYVALTAAEESLAHVIWREAPLDSPDLISLAAQELGWKKSATYTVLSNLCEKSVFKNEDSNVSVIITKDELKSLMSHHTENIFRGSLQKFVSSVFGNKKY